ncbi:MAG: FkbM family methyltransferase [Lachnospiraceae bacterium]|nr:FkbM family methyltransferase [Lachnospiraceae bacterium]
MNNSVLNFDLINKIDTIQEIKKCDRLAIYGNGEVAYRIRVILEENGISKYDIVVDDEYKEKLYKEDDSVKKLSELDCKIGIIIAILDYPNAEKKLSMLGFDKIFCMNRVFDTEEIQLEFFKENRKAFQQTYDWLVDQESKQVFKQYLKANFTNNPRELYDQYCNHSLQYQAYMDQIKKPFVWINGGAYIGDTLINFFESFGSKSFEKVYSFEPDKTNYQRLIENVEHKHFGKVECINKGLSNHQGNVSFWVDEKMTGGMKKVSEDSVSDYQIEVMTIDQLNISSNHIFINLDIEGSELAALEGAKETIIKNKPSLAISVYHKCDDLIRIPQYLKKLRPDYELHLRIYMPWAEEMVLYAL